MHLPKLSNGILDPNVRLFDDICPDDKFSCGADCLPTAAVCNFVSECSDGEDELNCTSNKCDFDDGDTCGWQLKNSNEASGSLAWTVMPNDTLNSKNKMLYPLSAYNGTGYLLLDPNGGSKGDSAEVTSLDIRHTLQECVLSFWYFCQLSNCPLQVFKVLPDSSPITLWDSIDGITFKSTESKWRLAKALIKQNVQAKVMFKAIVRDADNFVIGLDSVSFDGCAGSSIKDLDDPNGCTGFKCDNGHCIDQNLVCNYANDCFDDSDEDPTGICKDRIGLCTFENACDFWSKGRDENLRYTSRKSNANNNYLPKTDHTLRTESGRYLSLHSLQESSQSISRSIESPVLNGTLSADCTLRLWHNVIGNNDSYQLNIIRKDVVTGAEELVRSIVPDSVYDFWDFSELSLRSQKNDEAANNDFKVLLEFVLSGEREGSVNVDDISLSANCFRTDDEMLSPVCPVNEYMCSNGLCFTEAQKCNFVDDCDGEGTDEAECPAICDFSDDRMCGWTSPVDAPLTWGLNDINEPQDGPLTDSRGNVGGRYILVKKTDTELSGNESDSDNAYLQSQPMTTLSDECTFTFSYNSKNQTPLEVILELVDEGQRYTVMKLLPEEAVWKNGTSIRIAHKGFIFRLIIVSKFNANGYIALDDFRFTNCDPGHNNNEEVKTPAPVTVAPNPITCKVTAEQKCNGIYECEDGSDELNCGHNLGSCDFKGNDFKEECQWENAQKDSDFDWTISEQLSSNETGPQSLLVTHDRFLVASSNGKQAGNKAAIASPLLPPSTGICTVTFYYYMFGNEAGKWTLKVIIVIKLPSFTSLLDVLL